VARAYRELESVRLVITRRGGGTRVSTDPPVHPTPTLTDDLQQQVTTLIRQAQRLGATDQQIRDAVDAALDPTNRASTNRQPAPDDPRPPTSVDQGSRSS
jgi:GntR family transcriptional regulator